MLLLLLVAAGLEGSRRDAPHAGQSGEGSRDLHSTEDTQADNRGKRWGDLGVAASDLLSNLRGPALVKNLAQFSLAGTALEEGGHRLRVILM